MAGRPLGRSGLFAEDGGCGWWILSGVPLVPRVSWRVVELHLPEFVRCVSDASALWEGSLSEWWVWGGMAHYKVMPGALCWEGQHGESSLPGLKLALA